MKNLLLINPSSPTRKTGLGQRPWPATPPLALGYVAALTPADWHVRIVDEFIEPIDFDAPADLVGLTAFTCNAPRAYVVSRRFCERGIPVVMGGIHASMCPDEAGQYVDAVVIGEAESIWAAVLADAEKGTMQKTYRGERVSLDRLPIPRRDLFSRRYGIDLVLTTKGCPFNCSFCNVTVFNGSEYRRRPVEEVLDELAGIDQWLLYIVDDNLYGAGPESRERAAELFAGMIRRKLRKIWGCQASLNMGDDPEVLRLAYRAGCRLIFIGIESIHPASLAEMNKGVNLNRGVAGMKAAIARIHAAGIAVCGGFIFGNDHDDPDVFVETQAFIAESGLDAAAVSFLTPFPGTRLFDKLAAAHRLICNRFPGDWDRYDQSHLVFRPERCDLSELIRAVDRIDNQRGGTRLQHLGRACRTFLRTGNPTAARFAYHLNTGT